MLIVDFKPTFVLYRFKLRKKEQEMKDLMKKAMVDLAANE